MRVTAPVDFGVSYVAPFVALFQELYPDVTIDLHLTDRLVDLIEDRYDIAFRIGWLTDSSNLARKLMTFEEIAVASPPTVARLSIRGPNDLEGVPFVLAHAFSGKTDWTFEKPGISKTITTRVVSEMNMVLAMLAYVSEGYCFTILPDILVQKELANGSLKRLLPEWKLRKGGVYTVTPPNRLRSNALQRFLDMVHEKLGTQYSAH